MAFNKAGLYMASAGFGETNINVFTYLNAADTQAAMEVAGYFPSTTSLELNDMMFAVGSDGPAIYYVSSVTAGGNPVVLPVVSPRPGAYVFATHAGVANGGNDTFTVPGVVATDHALAAIQEETTVEVEAVQCGTDEVTVWYEGAITNKKIFMVVYRTNT